MYAVIDPDPALEPEALNVQFSVAPLPLMVHGVGLYENVAVGATGTLVDVVDVVLVDDVEVDVVVAPGTVVVVVFVCGIVVVVDAGTVDVVLVVTPTVTVVDAAAALVPQAFRLRKRTK